MKQSITLLFLLTTLGGCASKSLSPEMPRYGRGSLDPVSSINIVRRADWGAHALADGDPEQYKRQFKPNYLSIHHTDSRATDTRWSEQELLVFVQEYHQSGKTEKGVDIRFRDIAYHYLVGNSGNIYEGRALNRAPASFTHYLSSDELRNAAYVNGKAVPSKAVEKTVPGNTEGHITVSFICKDQLLSDRAMKNSAKLIAALLIKYDLTPKDIRAHREIANTECPGDPIYRWLRGARMTPQGKGEGMLLIEQEYQRLSGN